MNEMRFDEHGSEYGYDAISGYAIENCAFAAYRTIAEGLIDPARMESWIVRPSERGAPFARQVELELGLHGYITGLWFSPAGAVYATDLRGRLHVCAPEQGWKWIDLGRDVELHGVWGFDDRDLYLWGRSTGRAAMWRLSGAGLEAMPAPDGRITIVRGVSSELLYAAGDRGLLARWNGRSWTRLRLPTVCNASGLFASDPDDLWLTTDNGKLFEGTSHGWALRARYDAPLYDVARWRGTLYVAAGPRGLLKLADRTDVLESAALEIEAICLESRGDLLALTPRYLASSSEGTSFRIVCRDALALARSAKRPHWR
jgi:hypothetical protein